MYYVRIEDNFAAAHFLANYHGKCERLHGHNYRVRVTVGGNSLDEGGMLLDFGVLKKALKGVLSEYDHTNLNEMEEFRDGNPSAERIAYTIYEKLKELLPSVNITLVEVFETDRNLAMYSPD